MTGAAPLLTHRRGAAVELTLNRPDRLNALTPQLLGLLAEAVRPEAVGDASVVVLRGAGERAFSAGFDLDVLHELGPAAHDGDPLGTASAALRDCPIPVLAVLHGHTLGAAVELVASCDLRVARRDLRLAFPANRFGALYRPTGIDLIARRFGWATATELFAFGRSLDAETAFARGLVAAVADVDAIDDLVDGLVTGVGPAGGPGAQHARMLRQWESARGLDPAALAHWEGVRAAAVATRRITDPREVRS